jgi:hypothetical protein
MGISGRLLHVIRSFKLLGPSKPSSAHIFLVVFCANAELKGLSLRKTKVFYMAKKVRKRCAWTSEHERTSKALAKKKTPAAKIVKTQKRTEGATRQKAFGMGISLDSRA